jgi:DNA processing protein
MGKITIEDKNYPEKLKRIKRAPKIIYFKGKIKPNELCFAVVGARRCSSYGKQAALEIAGNLAGSGITVVSGLAPGIDTFAHRAVVEQGKRTIAVLGTGLDEKSIYPKENIDLARKIVDSGGLLVSEYPPGTKGARFTFPERNRIISGLSLGTLVIEAKEKSGALITANFAFSQERKVFAVPGSIYALNSRGPHILIKKGAKLIDKADDILQELKLPASPRETRERADNLTLEEDMILNTLKEESLYIDKIIEKTNLKTAVAVSTLSVLEIKGKVINLGRNIYALAGK